jgi:prefoldin alpha subunit
MEISKQQMFEAELLRQELDRIEQELQGLATQRTEASALREALSTLLSIEEGADILVPVANGIFIPAKASGEKLLRVNVGQGVVVKKTIPEAQQMIDGQLQEMQALESELDTRYDRALTRLSALEQRLKGQGGA